MNATPSRSDLAAVLGNFAIEMQGRSDTETTLQAIVAGALSIVPGARWSGISMIEGRTVTSRVPSADLVAELDQAQTRLGEGPCLSALGEQRTVLIADTATETRWPRFTRLAARRGVGSVLSFQLRVRHENLGALNLYGAVAGAFTDESIAAGEIVAQHASVALCGAVSESQLQTALASRDVIGQAKGILMARERLSGLQAFQLLLRTSQHTNIKLVDIARWIVDDHETRLPDR
ncbi:GAF and ANTAR domain-containing protein [Mycobacterium koreense]|uniref:Response regulator receiver protein n=1 Tax=Mycolicibacillus koreensis TaxID=1069220 RepID=A0A7I7SHC4_9MYCO|nr:GAF and ANTAR domain-containing protein [Mycolicibacillus koreensis]MCV7248386.1 GAF and ANTAR domain-containing protein [Mycolicibacillus koreensis]OSC34329.1 response regulator receiver protein [Mycolicibacillus koreensis]BBY55326.1 transcriptional regulator [Mycolicibacillus koreensis]